MRNVPSSFTSSKQRPILKERVLKDYDWQEVLNEFITLKKTEGLAWRTLDDYKSHIGRFFNRFPEAWKDESIQRECLLQHLNRGIGATAYNLDIGYLKVFLNYCIEQGIFTDNVAAKFKKRKTSNRIVDIPANILKELINIPDLKTYTGYRDYCLILLTLDCGIRPSEALTLLAKDINLKGKEIHVRAENAKTRVARTMPVSEHTIKALHKLIESRSDDWDNAISPVFCSWSGEMMWPASWRWRLIN